MLWILGLSVLAALILCGLVDSRCRRRRRRQWYQDRSPMPDDEFVATLALPDEEARMACSLRRAFAQTVGVPPQMIHPSDELEDVSSLVFDGLDFLVPVFRLERELGVKLPTRVLLKDPFAGLVNEDVPTKMGEIISRMARSVVAHVQTVKET